ncbi:hypothetical protein J45TS6_35290 [Paenibacillus sp. J45TS6]|uniref:hypothetical protein n=1 Tax=Paenibacillus sp. J45TS6 TaxID=2807196 RepID=UPI001B29220A|nr:hypothetical protein [Paenibacillus sp. J45TS6]GIP45070.1 hypothetical protein J45TS6_35290 [Paenibacillus sp. J45TS6]
MVLHEGSPLGKFLNIRQVDHEAKVRLWNIYYTLKAFFEGHGFMIEYGTDYSFTVCPQVD